MLEQCIFTISPALGLLQCIMLYPLDLSTHKNYKLGNRNIMGKEYIAICKTQVLLQNVATTFAHYPLC